MSRDLRFRRLRLRNWKNFLRVDVALQDRLFLVRAAAAPAHPNGACES